MFERYTEQARRTLFFSRYEASQLGSLSIETEHLLLGLIQEETEHTSRIFGSAELSLDNIRQDILRRTDSREKVGAGVEIPFSAETKRVLQFAAVEADDLRHYHILPEHLLLGLLREESSVASSILRQNGFDFAGLRSRVAAMPQALPGTDAGDRTEWAAKVAVRVESGDAARELEQVKKLVDRLASSLTDEAAAKQLIEQISSSLERLQGRFRT